MSSCGLSIEIDDLGWAVYSLLRLNFNWRRINMDIGMQGLKQVDSLLQ